MNLRDKTLVVFTSDNGGDIHSSNLPFAGVKSSLQEGGIRVPCIARWPGKVLSGTTVDVPAITMDWTATVRRLAGYPADPKREDGIDLLPLLLDPASKVPDRSLFWRRKSGPVRNVNNASRAVRKGEWKLLEATDGSGDRFLFNLNADPAETMNLIDENRDIAKQLSTELDRWETSVRYEAHQQ
ncbi:MAG: sulfatase-like hydrolase/transferase [Planctomycetales bacterium]|nr:sulfatase-like hydrolase/transferase [Planctomycetales bacterium]